MDSNAEPSAQALKRRDNSLTKLLPAFLEGTENIVLLQCTMSLKATEIEWMNVSGSCSPQVNCGGANSEKVGLECSRS